MEPSETTLLEYVVTLAETRTQHKLDLSTTTAYIYITLTTFGSARLGLRH
jgi:hypothetical protein